jgi:pimeloyl-ACP methyl ester carboxylesterase
VLVTDRVSTSEIHYRVVRSEGNTPKEWVVFCHGVWLNGDWWSGWYKNLIADYNLIVFDVPGYGNSPISADDLAQRTVAGWPQYILSVLDDMEIDAAHLVGESTGGGAVLHTIVNHPERVRAAVVCATYFLGSVLRPSFEAYPGIAARGGLEALADHVYSLWCNDNDDREIRDRFRQTQRANSLQVVLHDAASWIPVDLTEGLNKAPTPIMILAPGRSPWMTRQHAFAMEAALPNSRLILFGEATHSLAFTEADVASFLSQRFFGRFANVAR